MLIYLDPVGRISCDMSKMNTFATRMNQARLNSTAIIAGVRGQGTAKSAVLGSPLSCRFFIRGEPPNKNAASRAPFQERGQFGKADLLMVCWRSLRQSGSVYICPNRPGGCHINNFQILDK